MIPMFLCSCTEKENKNKSKNKKIKKQKKQKICTDPCPFKAFQQL